MPDIFVPEDTLGMTSYYINVSNGGHLQQYAYKIAEENRTKLSQSKNLKQFLANLPDDDTLLQGFVEYAASKGVPARWYYINQSSDLILRQLKAIIARDAVGYGLFIEILNSSDKTVDRAIKALSSGESPTYIMSDKKQE